MDFKFPLSTPDVYTIPKSSLGYNSNNIYPNFPPFMADGRSIVATDQSETVINNDLMKTAGVQSNWEYREFLTKNADKIRDANTREAFNDVGYYKRFVNSVIPNGEENGRPSLDTETDLKSMYLSKEQLSARLYSPSVTDKWIRDISNPQQMQQQHQTPPQNTR